MDPAVTFTLISHLGQSFLLSVLYRNNSSVTCNSNSYNLKKLFGNPCM